MPVVSTDIKKMDGTMDRSSQSVALGRMLSDTVSIQSFTHMITTSPEALTDFYTMCDKINGKGSAESAKAQ